MQRIFWLCLFALAATIGGTASAGTITFTEMPGTFTITNANWNGNTFAVVGNYANGNAFAFENGTFINLAMSNFFSVTPGGVAGNFILAGAQLSDLSLTDVIYSSAGNILSQDPSFGFTQVGNNSEFGAAGAPARYGYIDANGHVTNLQNVNTIGNETSGTTTGVNGGTVAGYYQIAAPDTLHAFLSINGVRQNLDVGTSSVALGVDASTNLAFGARNGKAVWWDATGAYHEIPNASGTGTISGDITSGFGHVFTVRDSLGNLWISNGTTTKSFLNYVMLLGVAATSTPADAFFVGNGTQEALVYESSIAYFIGHASDFTAPLATSAATPEPSTWVMMLVALAFGYVLQWRRRAA